jgi:hypothetical protein
MRLRNTMASTTSEVTPNEIVIISHSTIFYWWPVWLVGFLMAALTYLSGHVMAFVPPGTVAESSRTVDGHDGPRDVLVLPPGSQLPMDRATGEPLQPRLRMAASNNPGVIFTITLCLVIVITNVHMRGLWSVVVIMAIAFVAVALAVLGWWDVILNTFGLIDIHINALGYVSISLFLFLIWALTFLLYDRRMATIFSRGQVRVRTVIGGGEATYDTLGMRVEKHTDDFFRHWLLGFGSGDLTVQTSGTNAAQFEIPNVIFINRKLELIRRMLLEREVVGGRS